MWKRTPNGGDRFGVVSHLGTHTKLLDGLLSTSTHINYSGSYVEDSFLYESELSFEAVQIAFSCVRNSLCHKSEFILINSIDPC